MNAVLPCFASLFLVAFLAGGVDVERDRSAPKGGWIFPTAEELKKVEEAIPSELPAKPKRARKLLVYSLSHGFKHNSRLIGEEMLKLIERKTSAFALTINNDSTVWTSDYLGQFDAIAVLNATSLHGGFKGKIERHSLTSCMMEVAYSDAMPPRMEEKGGGRNTLSSGVAPLAVTLGGKPAPGEYKTMIRDMP